MTYNKQKNAALLPRLLSTLMLILVIAEREHTNNLMHKILTSFLLILTTFVSYGQQCSFSSVGTGDSCTTALPICGNLLSGITGTLPDPDFGANNPFLCNQGTVENGVWYQFIACESTVSIEVCPDNCTMGIGGTGMQGAIYSSCDATTFLDCSVDPINTCFTLTANSFNPGEIYYLLVDGYGGSICDYTINVLEGVYDDAYDLSTDPDNVISIVPEIDDCMDRDHIISFSATECMVQGGSCSLPTLFSTEYVCYEWTFDPPTVVFDGDENSFSVGITFLEEGEYTVSVERKLHPFLESCSTGACDDPPAITVNINFVDTIYNAPQIICPGETVNICGNLVGIDGVYECFDANTCTLTIDSLSFPVMDNQDLGVIALCEGECFELENIEYCDRDFYVIESTSSCATIYEFEIRTLFIGINEPNEYPIVDCNETPQFMNMVVSTDYENDLNYSYIDPFGVEISTETFASVSIPGEYVFYAFSPDFPSTCIDSVVFTIGINDITPKFNVETSSLTCSEREAPLVLNALENIVSFEWTGPAVSNPGNENAFATEPGTYYIEVIGENGCSGIDSIVVLEELLPADISIDFDVLSCENAMTALEIISDVAIDSVIWSGPFDITINAITPTVTDTGSYTATIYAENGCDYSEIIKILGSFVEPEFDVSQSAIWGCDTETVQLSATINIGDSPSYNWFTETGEIVSGQQGSNLTVGTTGTYFLEVIDGLNGCSRVDTFDIEADPDIPSQIEIAEVNPTCFGMNDGSIEIIDVVGGIGPFTYVVNELTTSDEMIENLPAGVYEFTLIDANDCELQRTIELEGPVEIQAEIEAPIEATYNEVIDLASIYDDTLFDVSQVNWYDSEGTLIGSGENINFTILQNETITMEVVDVNGCIVIKTRTISLDEDYDYFIPNVFTPDQNGVNDFFGIFSQNAPGEVKELMVYDRWGNRMYQLEKEITLPVADVKWGWDGTYNGDSVAAGVYVYYAVVETLGVTKELKGSVTLVR